MNLNEAGILAALIEKPHHGYTLIQRLNDMGIPTPRATGGLYRRLHDMEERGLVLGVWDLPERGPAKKTFHVTDKGKTHFRRNIVPEARRLQGAMLTVTGVDAVSRRSENKASNG